jgi:hypothetical protein
VADTMVIRLYLDGNGTYWRVRLKSFYAALSGLGWTADDVTKQFRPIILKMRYLTLTSVDSARHRILHVGSTAGANWNEFGTDLTLPNGDGTTSSYQITGSVGEKWRRA